MKFGRYPVAECEGAILAHSVRDDSILLEKGRVLTPVEMAVLESAGLADIMAAFLEDGDVAEDEAAGRIAEAIAGRGLECRQSARGRVNIHARRLSQFEIENNALDRLNAVDEGISIATLPNRSVAGAGQLVATVKIIPFSLPEKIIKAVEKAADQSGKICAHGYETHNIGLIQTELPGTPKKLLAKTRKALDERLKRLGSHVARNAVVPHHEDELAEVIRSFADEGLSPILIMGATATLDRRDVVPKSIRRTGGEIKRFGMPVDPGNLLVLGRRHDVIIIGMPGCARSPALNGFDLVLELVLAGIDVTASDISAMGAGGLLKEGPGRPQPREWAGERNIDQRSARKTAAVVLAAGLSRRMGDDNKLLSETPDGALIARTTASFLNKHVEKVVVVLGHQADAVRQALSGMNVEFVTNNDYEAGMGASIACGISALDADVDAALVVLGDMPLVKQETIIALIDALKPEDGITVAAPVFEGKRGNPVIWERSHFTKLQRLEGDIGARELLATTGEELRLVSVDDSGILFDVDTKEALQQLD